MKTTKIDYDKVFPSEYYRKVEHAVLGENKFNEEQKNFIHLFESGVIEAGPGSGKTTALSAKVALLLKSIEQNGSLNGICIITHTNAAVEEVLKVLAKLGYQHIPHPHFIGTINSFFNSFGMFPYVRIKYAHLNSKEINFIDESKLKINLKLELSKEHNWLNSNKASYVKNRNIILNRLIQSHLFYNDKGELDCITYENGSIDKYKEGYIDFKEKSWEKGTFYMNDTFPLSQKYFEYETTKKRLRNRFKFVLMDEYQDVSPLALNLLKDIFLSEENVFQIIGDRNQHISYSNPLEINIKDFNIYDLNKTNRFGSKISFVLNKMFDHVELEPAKPDKSLKPIIFLYQDTSNLTYKFEEILRRRNLVFNGDVAILVPRRNHANMLKEKLSETKQKRKNRTLLQSAQDKIYHLISKKADVKYQYIKRILPRDFPENYYKINRELFNYLLGKSVKDNLKNEINNFLNELGIKGSINKSNKVFDELKELKDKFSDNNQDVNPTRIPVKTVHDIKGQTLLASMLFLEKDSKEEFGFLKSYTDEILEPQYYGEMNKRVVYVAMSRPTTLLCVALKDKTYNNLSLEAKELLIKDFEIINEDDIN